MKTTISVFAIGVAKCTALKGFNARRGATSTGPCATGGEPCDRDARHVLTEGEPANSVAATDARSEHSSTVSAPSRKNSATPFESVCVPSTRSNVRLESKCASAAGRS